MIILTVCNPSQSEKIKCMKRAPTKFCNASIMRLINRDWRCFQAQREILFGQSKIWLCFDSFVKFNFVFIRKLQTYSLLYQKTIRILSTSKLLQKLVVGFACSSKLFFLLQFLSRPVYTCLGRYILKYILPIFNEIRNLTLNYPKFVI